jgi:hypothetical protein
MLVAASAWQVQPGQQIELITSSCGPVMTQQLDPAGQQVSVP